MSDLCSQGIIKVIHENSVDVEITLHDACYKCSAKNACMMGHQKQEKINIIVSNPDRFQVGESVLIEMQKSIGGKAIVLAYFFPFLILTFSLLVIYKISKNELLSVGVSFLMTLIYYIVLKKMKNKVEKNIVFEIKKMEE